MTEYEKADLTIQLKDGRKLGYADLGDPDGKPIFHFNGWPGCRLEATLVIDLIKDMGVRFIGVDRPGMGLSDFKKGRTFLDWPDDVIELADALGFDKFAVEGVSGGGPYSAACAYKIPDRLTACGIIGGIGPPNLSIEGMMKRNRRQFFVIKWFPWLIKLLMWSKSRSINTLEKAKKDLLNSLDDLPEPDRKWVGNPDILPLFAKETAEAFRQGSKGPCLEFMLYMKPWGFNLEDISPKLKVIIWQGEFDVNVPVSMGRAMSMVIPNCEGRFYSDEGHYSIAFNHIREIIEALKV